MKKIAQYALLCAIIVSMNACKNSAKDKDQESPTTETLMPAPTVVVMEEAIYDVPVVATPATEPAAANQQNAKVGKDTKAAPAKAAPAKTTAPKVSHSDLAQNLAKADITPARSVDTTYFSFSADPINRVQTVTSYEKKGNEVLKIVSDPADPDVIDHIVFTDKNNNVDVYGVGVGLSAKEAKELRKELKHFVKKGKLFLYTEDSNILYELDGVVSDGQVITDDYIDNMHVSSIIWKDKNKKDKDDKAKTK